MVEISKLTEADRGRLVKVYEEELGSFQMAVLANWNEKFLFLAWLDSCPPSGGHSLPDNVELTDERAILAYRYGLQFRPCSLGAQPRGFIPDSRLLPKFGPDWEHPERKFGCLDYPEKLSKYDAESYELNYLGPVWRLRP